MGRLPIGGGLLTTYFAAGGLLGAAWVNVVQLAVKLIGFAVALPFVLAGAGGVSGLLRAAPDPGYASFWNGGMSLSLVVLMVPAFLTSPGLLQKMFGARNEKVVRAGIGVNGLMLMLFGLVPALLGMAARMHHPGLPQELALPTLLSRDLPPAIGGLLLAAIFSAEVSSADAVLFMLSTSLSQDLYRRFINPAATDGQVLRAARLGAVSGGALGILIALVTPTIIGALSVFYAMLGATLLVPVMVAVHGRSDRRREVLASIVAGALAVLVVQVTVGNRAGSVWTPATVGLACAAGAYGVARLVRAAVRTT